jgi:hypothetical protein
MAAGYSILYSLLTNFDTSRRIEKKIPFRSLHLFLQTHLDMERIRQNASGVRDDQVSSLGGFSVSSLSEL